MEVEWDSRLLCSESTTPCQQARTLHRRSLR
ncbi:hypothetical protein MRX96_033038 [Rhipicephalus microplus]